MKITWHYVDAQKLRADTPPGQHPGITVDANGRAEKFVVLDRQSETKSWIWMGCAPGGSVVVVPLFALTPSGKASLAHHVLNEMLMAVYGGIPIEQTREVHVVADFSQPATAFLGLYVEKVE